jgi:carboxymethylenebutenolidase
MAEVPGAVQDPSRVVAEEVQIRRGADAVPAYLAKPRDARNSPGIVVIHEAFGLVEHIRDLARRFANLGYTAIAPDLYARAGAPDPSNMQSVMTTMFGLPDAQAIGDLTAAADHVRGLRSSNGRVASIGFCSGGRQSLLLACSGAKLSAAVDCWGGFVSRASPDAETTSNRPEKPLDRLDRLSCPLFGVFGAEDQNPSPQDAEEMEKRLKAAGKAHRIKVFPNAGHAFLADYRPSYRPGPAAELWSDLTAFFAEHLKPGVA